jgi:hypothetical protein
MLWLTCFFWCFYVIKLLLRATAAFTRPKLWAHFFVFLESVLRNFMRNVSQQTARSLPVKAAFKNAAGRSQGGGLGGKGTGHRSSSSTLKGDACLYTGSDRVRGRAGLGNAADLDEKKLIASAQFIAREWAPPDTPERGGDAGNVRDGGNGGDGGEGMHGDGRVGIR